MLPRLVDDPDRWLECVADMRSVAAELTDSDGRVIAVRVAKDLEWFADWVNLRKNDRRPRGDRDATASENDLNALSTDDPNE